MKKVKLVTAKTSRAIAWSTLRDYLFYLSDTKRIIKNNFIAGLMRGLGSAIGFSLLGAVIVYIITALAAKNLPLIGSFLKYIADKIS